MKNLIKITAFLCILVGLGMSSASAQAYNKSIGLGYTDFGTGISGKMFIDETAAIEAIISYRDYGSYISYSASLVNITALYELHQDLDVVDGLQWYYGGGVYYGSYSVKWDSGYGDGDYRDSSIGIAGVAGLEYKFADYPITLSGNWLPSFGFGDWYDGLQLTNGGGSIRYTF